MPILMAVFYRVGKQTFYLASEVSVTPIINRKHRNMKPYFASHAGGGGVLHFLLADRVNTVRIILLQTGFLSSLCPNFKNPVALCVVT